FPCTEWHPGDKEEARRERRPLPIRERQDLGDGFVLLDWNTLLHRVGKEAFSREPHLLMKAFQYQHRYGCRLGRELKEQIRGSLHLIDDAFCSSPEVRETFMEILGAKAGVAPTLRIMHELGVLGRYIPEFGRLTCFVHQDYYHRYTADEHTLVALEKLDEVAFTRESSLLEFSRLFKELERLHVLRLALLLHDIGKAKGPRHHHRSVEMVPPVTIRMGLPQDEGGLVEFLVAHHLSMSHISERRDTDDPKLVEDFVQEAGSPEKLKMLYLLTYADIAAIHPGAWTEWRGALLFELYKKCLLLMTEEASAQERRRLGDKREQVLGEVRAGGLGVTPSEVDRHFRLMPERYLLATSPQAIAQHIAMVKALSEQPLAYHLSHRRQIGYSECILCTPDHVGLFSQIAGVFALHEVSILSAQVYTRGDGIAVDTFQVQDSRGGAVTSEERWQRLFEDLRSVLEKGVGAEELLGAYRKYLKAKARGPFDVSTRVEIDNSVSEQYSVIDVQTQDRHGLLYLISKTLASLRVSIALAKITTEGVRAIDVFYVVDEEGRKIHDRERLEQLRLTLEEALGAPARSTGERGA
ncbi:MAG: HD domain-containing protein, partial [Nitrospinota bacterium]